MTESASSPVSTAVCNEERAHFLLRFILVTLEECVDASLVFFVAIFPLLEIVLVRIQAVYFLCSDSLDYSELPRNRIVAENHLLTDLSLWQLVVRLEVFWVVDLLCTPLLLILHWHGRLKAASSTHHLASKRLPMLTKFVGHVLDARNEHLGVWVVWQKLLYDLRIHA